MLLPKDTNLDLDLLSLKSPIVKNNKLVEAQYDELTAIEYKIILSALSKITPYDDVLDYISFEAQDFCKLLHIQKSGMYSHLKRACDKLIKRIITIETSKDEWEKFPWCVSIKYDHGKIKILFNQKLEPYLLYHKKNKPYTKYLLANIIDMDSRYSIRLYEILKQWQKSGKTIFTIKRFKELLGIPETKYKQIEHLKRKVLIPSKNEINGLSDLNIDYNTIKIGKKIEKLEYIIQGKNYKLNSTEYDLFPKLKLIAIIRGKIYDLTGQVMDVKTLDSYHRILLIELIKYITNGNLNKILICHPRNFFISKLEYYKLEHFDENAINKIPDF